MSRQCRPLTSIGVMLLLCSVSLATEPVNLSTWSQHDWDFPDSIYQPPSQWVLSSEQVSVTQTINSDPSAFLNNRSESTYTMVGTWLVPNARDDNDIFGFVFGYRDSTDLYVLDWKRETQGAYGYGTANAGLSVKRIYVPPGDTLAIGSFWRSIGTRHSTILAALWLDTLRWYECVPYYFELDAQPGRFSIAVWDDDNVIWDVTVVDSLFWGGQFGFYNFSQENVQYYPYLLSQIDPARSFSDSRLVVCPAGDVSFSVFLRDGGDSAIVGSDDVWLDFSACTQVVPCSAETNWPIVRPSTASDSTGRVVFYVQAGHCDEACQVAVRTSCGLIGTVPFKTVDRDGDLVVTPLDHDTSSCNDLDCDGKVALLDLAFQIDHLGHDCAPIPCGLMGRALALYPDTGLVPGRVVDAQLTLENASPNQCGIDSVDLYHSGFDLGATPVLVGRSPVGDTLREGEAMTLHNAYTVPGEGQGCVSARVHTSCCDTAILAEYCVNAALSHCAFDTAVTFSYWVPTAPVFYHPIATLPDGFSVTLNPPGGEILTPDSVTATLTIDSLATLGDSASVVMLFYADATLQELVGQRQFRVYFTQQGGAVNMDCQVTAADIIYLVGYVFKGGPPPYPCEAVGDVNCDGAVNATDIIYLVNYVFKSGSPPCEVVNSPLASGC